MRSIIDFGCGLGTWLEAFVASGVEDYLGIDGAYVDPAQLRIPPVNFRSRDLSQAVHLERRFDLACALEVAEHLPESAADAFVATLVGAAPRVLFSAAVPGQGGNNRVNEQWQSYWAERLRLTDSKRSTAYGLTSTGARMSSGGTSRTSYLFCKPEAAPRDCIAESDAYTIDRAYPQIVRNLELAPHSGRQAVTVIGRGLRILARKSSEHLGFKPSKPTSVASAR